MQGVPAIMAGNAHLNRVTLIGLSLVAEVPTGNEVVSVVELMQLV